MNRYCIWTILVATLCLSKCWGQDAANFSADQAVEHVTKLCRLAQKEYSTKYGVETSAVKADLVAKLQEYQRAVDADARLRSDAREFAKMIDIPKLLDLSASSPTRFRDAVQAAQESVQKYVATRATDVEREKSLNVLMNYYLSVVAREESDASGNSEIPAVDADVEAARRENFCYFCDQIPTHVASYFDGGGDAAFDALVAALGEAQYYQPESPSVAQLACYLGELFAGANVYFEANERFLTALTMRDVSENFVVNETIRGTATRGNGALRGRTYVDVMPNCQRAELAVVLNANVATSTVGANRGVNVYSDSSGNVLATKRIFLNNDGTVTTSPALAQANMRSSVRSINTDRMTLFGGAVIRNKVGQELPYSEREGNERMKRRVAQELETQANAQIIEMNRRFSKMTSAHDSMIRGLSTRTTADRFYLSCVVGKRRQLTTPKSEVERAVENVCDELYLDVAPSVELGAEPSQHSELLVNSRTALALAALNNRYSEQTVATSEEPSDDSDVLIRFHQSAPNNAAAIALAGVVFGPGYDALDDVLLRFPGVDPVDVRKLLAPYEPKEAKPLDPEDNYKQIFVRFDEVRPFTAEFKDNTIVSSLHISSCDVDGKEWGPVDVRMTYRLERRDSSFVFVRNEVEVIPGGYQEGDAVSARFNTFRRIFIKRLETAILDEYPISPVPVETIASTTNRGALVVSDLTAQDGWVTIKFRFEPNYNEDEE